MTDVEPAQPDAVDAFIAFVDGHAAILLEVGTPQAMAAGDALAAAMRAMGDAFRQMQAAFNAAVPTQH